MTLKIMPPIAQVFIGFSSSFLKSQHQDENTALYAFKAELSACYPEYQFSVHSFVQKADWDLKIINAHLNYEAVAYLDGKIEYPYVKSAISESIRDLQKKIANLDNFASEDELAQIEQSKARYQLFSSAESMIEELNAHMKYRRSEFLFRLNYAEQPEILLISNNSGHLCLYASHEISIQTLKKVGVLVDEIALTATLRGVDLAKKSGQPKLNPFSSVILPNIELQNFRKDREIIVLVQEFTGCLKDLDPQCHISEQLNAVWEIYLYSFKSAVINKIKEIAYGIRTN